MVNSEAALKTSRAATLSIVSNATLALMKLVAGFLTGSIGVLAEGIHSTNDLLASFLAWFAIRKANQPADAEHRFGHGKYESLSALVEATLIILAAIAVVWQAVARLASHRPLELAHGPALIVMGFSALANFLVSGYLFKIARRYDSMALEADSWHLRADVWTSIGVFAALAIITVTDWHVLDPLSGILVAGLILFQGSRIGRDALRQLLDQSLPPAEVRLIEGLLSEHDKMFVDYHRLRTRKSGRERQIDLHLVTCPKATVEEAHQVCDHLEQDLAANLPNTRVVIHVEPCNEQTCSNWSALVRNPDYCLMKQHAAGSAQASEGGSNLAGDT